MSTTSASVARRATAPPKTTPWSKGGSWVNKLPTHASRIYFLLIILQVPLFRVACRAGMCSSPMHVTASQIIASSVLPVPVVKCLLYPGALANGLVRNMSVPSWDHLLTIYNLTDAKDASPLPDLHRLEVLVGSYFSVAGAFVGLVQPRRMSMFGTLLMIWGLVKEGILGKPPNTDPATTVYIYPTMLLALLCAISSVKYNAKKAITTAPPRPTATPLQSSAKSKLK